MDRKYGDDDGEYHGLNYQEKTNGRDVKPFVYKSETKMNEREHRLL